MTLVENQMIDTEFLTEIRRDMIRFASLQLRDDALADMINDIYPAVEVAGTAFDPAYVIRSCDPIAWSMMVADEFNDVDLDDYPDA